MVVKRLENNIINQIAAGEVVERPASVVKELLDNAIDAKATRIDISVADGGKTLIKVVDNGTGMDKADLQLAVERHCTSKITNDLHNIETLGFRGEALPSIGSVARLKLSSKTKASQEENQKENQEENMGWEISVEGGKATAAKPTALAQGTIVEVRDLFYATPARLKFLKSERSELASIADIFKRIVLAHPDIHFTLRSLEGYSLEYINVKGETKQQALLARIGQVLGEEFKNNAMQIEAKHEHIKLTGYAGLPTFNRGNALHQFFYVNGRNVRDKQLLGAVRAAYMDSMMRFRHAVLVLFFEIEPSKVDINVHPAKSEVRFFQANVIRSLIVRTLKDAIVKHSHQSSSEGGRQMIDSFSRYQIPAHTSQHIPPPDYSQQKNSLSEIEPSAAVHDIADENLMKQPLGAARAQIHKNYIIAQTQDGMIIVDQHAAHERLVYERIKQQWQEEGVASQILLIPDIVELNAQEINALSNQFEVLKKVGLEMEVFSANSIMVRATPALLGTLDAKALLQDLIDDIEQWGGSSLLEEKIHHVAATLACYGSVRSGRLLKADEMNKLLRDMETTPNSGQCNHGRPTYIELKLKDIEKLFGR